MTEAAIFQFHRFDAALGREIVDFDLSRPLDDQTFAAVRRVFLESEGLLVFHAQYITPEQHVAFSRRFGPLLIHVLRQYLLPGASRNSSHFQRRREWRSRRPSATQAVFGIPTFPNTHELSLGPLLHALELPAEGRDTSFANMRVAYDALAAEVKQRIEGKRAVHSYSHSYDRSSGSKWRRRSLKIIWKRCARVVHPVVRIHPETGRKALFVNQGFTSRILDLPEAESRELLELLFVHSTKPRFVYRHRWQDHDLFSGTIDARFNWHTAVRRNFGATCIAPQ